MSFKMLCLKAIHYKGREKKKKRPKKPHTNISGGTDGDELNPVKESSITIVLTQNAKVFLSLESHKEDSSLRDSWTE